MARHKVLDAWVQSPDNSTRIRPRRTYDLSQIAYDFGTSMLNLQEPLEVFQWQARLPAPPKSR